MAGKSQLLKNLLTQLKTPIHWLIGAIAKLIALIVHLAAENIFLTVLTSVTVGFLLLVGYKAYKKRKNKRP